MNFFEKVVEKAKYYLKYGFNPHIRPACADFVSTVLKEAGWKEELENPHYVPCIVLHCEKVSKQELLPGHLIVFEQTYDAVPPAGIGTEDDMTHIGIFIGKGEFIHYSASSKKVVKANLSLKYWQDRIQFFMKVPGMEEGEKYGLVKVFYHKGAPPSIIIDGKKYEIISIGEEGTKYLK